MVSAIGKCGVRLAFVFTGSLADDGWTYSHNLGRLALESEFGGLVDASTYVQNVLDGEFDAGQRNKGSTIATGTPTNGSMYGEALELLKSFCDEDFDLVFTTSFGFRLQTIDVSSGYEACRRGADGSPHVTHFAHATGDLVNNITSVMFGKVYQAKYLVGLVAGGVETLPSSPIPGPFRQVWNHGPLYGLSPPEPLPPFLRRARRSQRLIDGHATWQQVRRLHRSLPLPRGATPDQRVRSRLPPALPGVRRASRVDGGVGRATGGAGGRRVHVARR